MLFLPFFFQPSFSLSLLSSSLSLSLSLSTFFFPFFFLFFFFLIFILKSKPTDRSVLMTSTVAVATTHVRMTTFDGSFIDVTTVAAASTSAIATRLLDLGIIGITNGRPEPAMWFNF